MAHGLLKSVGFEMKSQVGESVESSALVSAPRTFCASGHRLDACVCVCVCSFQLNAEVLSHVPKETEDSLVPKSSLSFSVSCLCVTACFAVRNGDGVLEEAPEGSDEWFVFW